MKATHLGVLLLVLTTARICEAQTVKTFGEWTVSRSDEDLVAWTSLDGGEKALGYRCYGSVGKCAHVLRPDIECEPKSEYPVLVNHPDASLSISCTCYKTGASFELVPEFADFNRLLRGNSSGFIGFAIPMASGYFKVIRFNLRGVKEAMEYVEDHTRRDSAEYH